MDTLYGPGCGFGFWHNWAAFDALDPARDRTIIATSGSAFAATCHLCRLDVAGELQRCSRLRRSMLRSPKRTLRGWLQASLPEDCADACRGLQILARQLPCLNVVVLQWETRAELIECLLASASFLCVHRYHQRLYTDCTYLSPPCDTIPSKLVWTMPSPRDAELLYREGMAAGLRIMSTRPARAPAEPPSGHDAL
jgi:hypothetical protein